MMRQPQPPDPIAQLREFCAFAVPLRIRELEWDIAAGELRRTARAMHDESVIERALQGMVRRGGASLGKCGDTLLFSDRKPRMGRARDTVVRTTSDLVTGIAAAAILAGPDGVEVLGDRYASSGRTAPAEPAVVDDEPEPVRPSMVDVIPDLACYQPRPDAA